jgi:general stress protein YciG
VLVFLTSGKPLCTLNGGMTGALQVMLLPNAFPGDFLMASNNQGNQGGQGNKQGSSGRGFASMDPQRQREIASEGGRAAHEKGTAHEFTSEEAREAGRKGGQARSQSNRTNANRGTGTGSSGSTR